MTGCAPTRACSTRRRTRSSRTSTRCSIGPGWRRLVGSAVCPAPSATSSPSRPAGWRTTPVRRPTGAGNGTFYLDATDPGRWTRFALAPTTFHEAIPGHHLQVALALELDLHPVLGQLEVTAYGEGWGLYAERLADEMGLYATPLQRVGMLTLDSLRASRLVVDTGIHAKGWTRQRAIDFLYDHTALVRSNVESEIDRYIADPGQAASYMIGRLEIDRLRADAARRLGNRFSMPRFHDTILQGGMTPLAELARRINAWIETITP